MVKELKVKPFPFGTEAELVEHQLGILRKIVPAYAGHTEFGRARLSGRLPINFAELDGSGIEVTEDDLRERMPELTRDDVKIKRVMRTSATTGRQKDIPYTMGGLLDENVAFKRYMKALGTRISDKVMVLVPKESSLKGLIPMLCKIGGISLRPFWVGTDDYSEFLEELEGTDVIFTYSRNVDPYLRQPEAQALIRKGKSPLKAVYSAGSAISPDTNELLDSLGLAHANAVNSIDHGVQTIPCRLGENHLSPTKRFRVDEKTSELLITDLSTNWAWVSLNCHTGDIGGFAYDCPCGERVLPTLEITGRLNEPMKHYPGPFFEQVKIALADDFPDLLTGIGYARRRHSTPDSPEAVIATLETRDEPSPADYSRLQDRFVRYSTQGSKGHGIPANEPVKAFLAAGGEQVRAFELILEARQFSAEERAAELAKHKPKIEAY